jgi:hypothetical protein
MPLEQLGVAAVFAPCGNEVCHQWSPVLRAARFGAWTMPDALELLTTRRSFKAVELAGPPPSAAEIDTLLTVASRVPDHGKLVPWRFIVFEGEARASGRRRNRRRISRQVSGRKA